MRVGAQVLVLTALAMMAVLGHNRLSGDVVLRLSQNHGLHRSDLLVAALWLLGVCLCLRWRSGAERGAGPRV